MEKATLILKQKKYNRASIVVDVYFFMGLIAMLLTEPSSGKLNARNQDFSKTLSSVTVKDWKGLIVVCPLLKEQVQEHYMLTLVLN